MLYFQSHDSMNGQFNSLKNNLDELNIESKLKKNFDGIIN